MNLVEQVDCIHEDFFKTQSISFEEAVDKLGAFSEREQRRLAQRAKTKKRLLTLVACTKHVSVVLQIIRKSPAKDFCDDLKKTIFRHSYPSEKILAELKKIERQQKQQQEKQ